MKNILLVILVAASLFTARQAQACRYIFDNQGQPLWDCSDDNPQGGCWWDVDYNGNPVWTCSNKVAAQKRGLTERADALGAKDIADSPH